MITSSKSFIYMSYKENFYTQKLIEALQQKNLFVVALNHNFLPDLRLDYQGDALEIKYKDNKKTKFNTPFNFYDFFKYFLGLLSSYSINFDGLNYFPYIKKISYGHYNINSNETHNIIFSNLLLHQNNGISKLDLYEFIWPTDKEIFMNKLDTHLTNLKNYINSESNLNLKISTIKGRITLI